ncbi:putative amidase AmiB2 domain protein [Mycobacterium xenopi 3993]|nr:putative amidase AmiB2 domain protein [Mycobacterium xenopi 3993]
MHQAGDLLRDLGHHVVTRDPTTRRRRSRATIYRGTSAESTTMRAPCLIPSGWRHAPATWRASVG